MAGDKANRAEEYRELLQGMLGELDAGCRPDVFALEKLRSASKSLINLHKGQSQPSAKRLKSSKEGKGWRLNATVAIWNDILYRYCQPKEYEQDGFQRAFTMNGKEGYAKFVDQLRVTVERSIDNEMGLSNEEKECWKEEFLRSGGWLQMVPTDLKHLIWENLEKNLNSNEKHILGTPSLYKKKIELLESWTKELMLAKGEANVKYSNKVEHIGNVSIASVQKKGVRPSRCTGVRSIHFLRPEQIKIMDRIGKGVQGEVKTCQVLDCPLILKNTVLVVKQFKKGDKHKKRADALQEVMMGGLNHRGIIGALGMTIQDPPMLIYDLYNGGDLGSFIDRCNARQNMVGKSKMDDSDFKFISERKIFLENRLGIALALLETMQYFHDNDRVHCDLHFGNILLHFEHENDIAKRVYVGICDFGMSKHLSQCKLKDYRMWPVAEDKVTKYRGDFPQLAPELVGPNPEAYSEQTDTYSLGNILKTLLYPANSWDDMSPGTRYLFKGWNAQYYTVRLHDMISAMMHKTPSKRKDCAHWIMQMPRFFPDCDLRPKNSPYLRD